MSNDLILEQGQQMSLSAAQVRQQVNLIQDVMREVMQEGQHFGKIPGCGDKPTLLKPGAEKLSMTFRLRPIIDNDRDIRITEFQNGHREIHVYCHVHNMQGVELATGVGSCSTMESKYRYRGGEKIFTGQSAPKEYWNLKKEGKFKEAKEKIGGDGFGVAKNPETQQWEICEIGEKAENPDIADTYNTVLKMAKKRAYVDGILSATGASDIFTQDLEDLPHAETSAVKTETKPTASKPPVSMPESTEEPMKAVDIIALSQAKVGDKLNVAALVISSKKSEDKKPHQYAVVDVLNEATVQLFIKVFGDFVDVKPGTIAVFKDVQVGEYNEKKQYVAQGVSSAS